MPIQSVIEKRRSIRRFTSESVPYDTLLRLVELSRLYASGGNKQPIRYAVISSRELCDQVFADLKWAMYLPNFEIGPSEQPKAYIVLLRDSEIANKCEFDVGAAATTLMLAAKGEGLDTCCLRSFSSRGISEMLSTEARYVPELVIAIGYAAEKSSIVPYHDSVAYTKASDDQLLVPKLTVEDVLLFSDIDSSVNL